MSELLAGSGNYGTRHHVHRSRLSRHLSTDGGAVGLMVNQNGYGSGATCLLCGLLLRSGIQDNARDSGHAIRGLSSYGKITR
jgi:hypothetical protein